MVYAGIDSEKLSHCLLPGWQGTVARLLWPLLAGAGRQARVYYLVSVQSFEAITLTPTLAYHF